MKLFSASLALGLLASLLLLVTEGCRKTDPAPDPCLKVKSVTADFKVTEDIDEGLLKLGWVEYDTDTIISLFSPAAVFTATEQGAAYEWKIGAKTYTKKSVYLQGFPLDTPIPITLSVKKNLAQDSLQLRCNPSDDGLDTKTRYVVFVDPCRSLLTGRYRGVRADEPGSPYEIDIDVCYNFYKDKTNIRMKNLTQGCDLYLELATSTLGYRQIYFNYAYVNDQTGCYGEKGTARVIGAGRDSLVIDYKVIKDKSKFPYDYIDKTFKGKRI